MEKAITPTTDNNNLTTVNKDSKDRNIITSDSITTEKRAETSGIKTAKMIMRDTNQEEMIETKGIKLKEITTIKGDINKITGKEITIRTRRPIPELEGSRRIIKANIEVTNR